MSTAIGNVLISYDIDSKHPQVKAGLVLLGYLDEWKNSSSPRIYLLPNTTLWKVSTTTDQALLDIQTVCKGLSVKLEKFIAVRATDFVGI